MFAFTFFVCLFCSSHVSVSCIMYMHRCSVHNIIHVYIICIIHVYTCTNYTCINSIHVQCMYNIRVLHMVVMSTVCAGFVPDIALLSARVLQSWTSCSQEVCGNTLLFGDTCTCKLRHLITIQRLNMTSRHAPTRLPQATLAQAVFSVLQLLTVSWPNP